MTINYKDRLKSLKRKIGCAKLDSFLVTNGANIRYLSGFEGHDAIILVTDEEDFFITDSRYVEEVKKKVKGYNIRLVKASAYNTLKDVADKYHLKRMGFESGNLPYEVASKLRRLLSGLKLRPVKEMAETMRAVKDSAEIALIRDSIELTKKTIAKIAPLARSGITEEFMARQAELEFIKKGAKAAFEPIVASGANSSKPHAIPTEAKIRKNSFVMIDIGCALKGYCSDITRMVLTGEVKQRFKAIYDIVRSAQAFAMDIIRPGTRIGYIDLAARNHIMKKGFGKYFGHALGHGVGLEVHEAPSISKLNTGFLKPGMVFTVEPAIYIPGFGGVRIEDMVMVTDKGCEVLTR